jgi:uncharacterized protein
MNEKTIFAYSTVKTTYMKILISPAKSLDYSRTFEVPQHTQPQFLNETNELVNKLSKLSMKKLSELMHLSLQLTELNYQRYKNWESPEAISSTCQPAVNVFTGEVYKGLDVDSFSQKDYEQAQKSLRILSGLYGLLRPLDLMYPYRLEMGTKWEIDSKTKNLYSFWGDKITDALNNELSSDEEVINLASNEYFKAITTKKLKARVITPVFKELKGDQFKVVMMYAKHARGAMARDIIQSGYTDANDLKGYSINGYSFNASLSSENEWVFVR